MKKSLVALMRGQQRLEALGVAVGQLLRRDPLALGRLRDRLAVLVRAREEEHVLAALAHVAGEDVRADRRVRVPEVGRGVHVEDRRGDVVGHRAVKASGGARCAAARAPQRGAARRTRAGRRSRSRPRPGERVDGAAAGRRRRTGGPRQTPPVSRLIQVRLPSPTPASSASTAAPCAAPGRRRRGEHGGPRRDRQRVGRGRPERDHERPARRGQLLARLAAQPDPERAPQRLHPEIDQHDRAGDPGRQPQRLDLQHAGRARRAGRRVRRVDHRHARAERQPDPEPAAQRRADDEQRQRPELGGHGGAEAEADDAGRRARRVTRTASRARTRAAPRRARTRHRTPPPTPRTAPGRGPPTPARARARVPPGLEPRPGAPRERRERGAPAARRAAGSGRTRRRGETAGERGSGRTRRRGETGGRAGAAGRGAATAGGDARSGGRPGGARRGGAARGRRRRRDGQRRPSRRAGTAVGRRSRSGRPRGGRRGGARRGSRLVPSVPSRRARRATRSPAWTVTWAIGRWVTRQGPQRSVTTAAGQAVTTRPPHAARTVAPGAAARSTPRCRPRANGSAAS